MTERDRAFIKADWDEHTREWFVVESSFPGLAAKGRNVEDLIRRLRAQVPELARGKAEVSFRRNAVPLSLASLVSCLDGECCAC